MKPQTIFDQLQAKNKELFTVIKSAEKIGLNRRNKIFDETCKMWSLRSRFLKEFTFANHSPEELGRIFNEKLSSTDFQIQQMNAEIDKKIKKENAKLNFHQLLSKVPIEQNPIYQVVEPLKKDAMDKAEEFAKQQIQRVKDTLKKFNYDINACAPYPSSFYGLEYDIQLANYKLFSNLTTQKDSNQIARRNEPRYVVVDSKKVNTFIQQTRNDAKRLYDAFVLKLIEKIGAVQSAELEGNHVWKFSILTVVTSSGERQQWKTQSIWNVSKFGLVFTQYPTRKMKLDTKH